MKWGRSVLLHTLDAMKMLCSITIILVDKVFSLIEWESNGISWCMLSMPQSSSNKRSRVRCPDGPPRHYISWWDANSLATIVNPPVEEVAAGGFHDGVKWCDGVANAAGLASRNGGSSLQGNLEGTHFNNYYALLHH